jgi:hypothetical protein
MEQWEESEKLSVTHSESLSSRTFKHPIMFYPNTLIGGESSPVHSNLETFMSFAMAKLSWLLESLTTPLTFANYIRGLKHIWPIDLIFRAVLKVTGDTLQTSMYS